ncbi:MAG: hypothetical protein QXU88_01250 [Candidatus Woesearchaeota archaeon]
MSKLKKILTNWRVIILLLFLIFAIIAIKPSPWADGVAIRAIARNSSAALAGIPSPDPSKPLMSRERILWMNGIRIKDVNDYEKFVQKLKANESITVQTTKATYKLVTKPKLIDNESSVVAEELGLRVFPAPKSNIRKGLELQGGTRVVLQPERLLDQNEFDILIEGMKERLNVFGLTDVSVRAASDLPKTLGGTGKQFVVVEIAGVTEEEVKDLLAKQGKFEAKIGNETVFVGGRDITYVCRTADCSGLDPTKGCGRIEGGWVCGFRFSISLSPEAAARHANITSGIPIITKGGERFLEKQLDLYLDDTLVDTLNIAAELKGRVITDIAISGPGSGVSQEEAVRDALNNMKKLQTILITGSLPVKLEIVKTDTISAVLGEGFVKNAIFVGLLAILAVCVVVMAHYRNLLIAIPMGLILISELLLILGFAALVGWNIDLAAIAGIIIAIGTGVDALVIIADESQRKGAAEYLSIKEKIKRSFSIIFASYSTLFVAMIPLLFAGAGLLKGFAITTIAATSFGVLIARPAFAAIMQVLLGE